MYVASHLDAKLESHLTHITDYSKLPQTPPVDIVFVLDPLIATGGTACAALAMIIDWGIPGEGVRPCWAGLRDADGPPK
jgi:uracil phosphoribosyltransferase